MSVKVMSAVWELSAARENALLVLLAIADSCDHDGTNAWPSQLTIGRKTRLSRRTVQRQIRVLVELGELAVVPGPAHIRSDRRPCGYEVHLPGLGASDWRPVDTTGRQRGSHGAPVVHPRGVTGDAQPVPTDNHPDSAQIRDVREMFAETRRHLRGEA